MRYFYFEPEPIWSWLAWEMYLYPTQSTRALFATHDDAEGWPI